MYFWCILSGIIPNQSTGFSEVIPDLLQEWKVVFLLSAYDTAHFSAYIIFTTPVFRLPFATFFKWTKTILTYSTALTKRRIYGG